MSKRARSQERQAPRPRRRRRRAVSSTGADAGYTPLRAPVAASDRIVEGIRETLRRARWAAKERLELAEKPSGDPVVDAIVELFQKARSVPEDVARRALEPLRLEEWQEAGLLDLRDGLAVPLVRLAAYQGLVVAADLSWSAGCPRDAVMGLTGSTSWLARLTVRRRTRHTLDLGTGNGLQAMLAARHSERVLAIDVNPRALAFAQFSARINGFTNIDFAHGDWFEPAAGRRFDQIVCNPPFVISPETETLYRDNPYDGDDLVTRIVRQMPEHLEEGALGQMICDWVEPAASSWSDRLASRFRDCGCDALALRILSKDPAAYVGAYAATTPALRDAWLAYFATQGIEKIGFGLICLRRRTRSSHWFSADKVPKPADRATGEDVARAIAARDFLEGNRSDETLLGAHLRVSPSLRIEPRMEPGPKGWLAKSAQLSLSRGFGYVARVDRPLMELLLRCDGRRSLRDLVADAATRHQKGAEEWAQMLTDVVRRLIAFGFVWPVAPASVGAAPSPDQAPPAKNPPDESSAAA